MTLRPINGHVAKGNIMPNPRAMNSITGQPIVPETVINVTVINRAFEKTISL